MLVVTLMLDSSENIGEMLVLTLIDDSFDVDVGDTLVVTLIVSST